MSPEQYATRYSSPYDRLYQQLLEPLEALGINVCWRYAINENGDMAFLGCNREISEFFFGEGVYATHPFYRNPKAIPTGTTLQALDPLLDERQKPMWEKFRMHQVCQHFHWGGDFLYGFGVATTIAGANLNHFYLNQQHFFMRFLRHFYSETQHIWRSAFESRINILAASGQHFHSNLNSSSTFPEPHLPSPWDLLSQRERETLHWLVRGHSASSIAIQLGGISHRTVESYLENIKSKWNCTCKQELIQMSLELMDLKPVPG